MAKDDVTGLEDGPLEGMDADQWGAVAQRVKHWLGIELCELFPDPASIHRLRKGTANDLFQAVLARLDGSRGWTPSLRLAYYHVRLAVRDVSHNKRARPKDRLTELLSPQQRRELWEELRQRLSVEPPPLHFSSRVQRINLVLFLAVLVLIILWIAGPLSRVAEHRLGPWSPPIVILLFFIELIFHPVSRLMLAPIYTRLRHQPPENCRTVRQLSDTLARKSCPELREEVEWAADRIWYALRLALADHSLPAQRIRLQTQMIEVLGAERCRACRYDLRGSDGQCPECGLLIEATPVPPPVALLLVAPRVGPENLARYVLYNIRRAFFSVGVLMFASTGFLYALHFRGLAAVCALGGAWGVLATLLDRHDFPRPFLWRPVFCPDCGSRLRVDRLGYGNDYALTCEGCQARYDAPAHHPPPAPAATSPVSPTRAEHSIGK